jgi:hypothetical protein
MRERPLYFTVAALLVQRVMVMVGAMVVLRLRQLNKERLKDLRQSITRALHHTPFTNRSRSPRINSLRKTTGPCTLFTTEALSGRSILRTSARSAQRAGGNYSPSKGHSLCRQDKLGSFAPALRHQRLHPCCTLEHLHRHRLARWLS